jgi:N-glycosidase YbiA
MLGEIHLTAEKASMNHKLDTDTQVFFYEQDFYVLSNFSAFELIWKRIVFPTSEHAYHWEKFPHAPEIRQSIIYARSAHEAFKVAERHVQYRRSDWHDIRTDLMRDILREKAKQHEYVARKLLQTGDRELIEDSWRDDFWGWGSAHDGQNMLGKLWMDIRDELRSAHQAEGKQ